MGRENGKKTNERKQWMKEWSKETAEKAKKVSEGKKKMKKEKNEKELVQTRATVSHSVTSLYSKVHRIEQNLRQVKGDLSLCMLHLQQNHTENLCKQMQDVKMFCSNKTAKLLKHVLSSLACSPSFHALWRQWGAHEYSAKKKTKLFLRRTLTRPAQLCPQCPEVSHTSMSVTAFWLESLARCNKVR